jgi:hypothetical protein
MLSKAEKKFLEVRKLKGKRLEGGRVILPEKYYSKNYQKVLEHRIIHKLLQNEEDDKLVREHSDIYKKFRELDSIGLMEYWKELDKKREERNKPTAEVTEKKKQLLWELEQVEHKEKEFLEPKKDLGIKKEPIVKPKRKGFWDLFRTK